MDRQRFDGELCCSTSAIAAASWRRSAPRAHRSRMRVLQRASRRPPSMLDTYASLVPTRSASTFCVMPARSRSIRIAWPRTWGSSVVLGSMSGVARKQDLRYQVCLATVRSHNKWRPRCENTRAPWHRRPRASARRPRYPFRPCGLSPGHPSSGSPTKEEPT